jgi:hypothetical protein
MGITTKTVSYPIRFVYDWGQGFPKPLDWQNFNRTTTTGGGSVNFQPYDGGTWRQNIRRKVTATTSMWGTHVNFSGGFSHYRAELSYVAPYGVPGIVVWVNELRGDWAGYQLGVPSDPSLLNAEAVNNLAAEKLVKRALNVQRQFQAGVFMGELAETIRFIRNPLSSIFENTLQYCDRLRKRGRIYKRLKDRKKLVTDSWLQYSFGIAPLVNDIENACEAAAKIITYRMPSQVVRGSASKSVEVSQRNLSENFGLIGMRGRASVTSFVSVRYTACVKASNDTDKAALESVGLTWGDFFPTLWEILPYSFLVDYFLNVGTIIDTLSLNEANLGWVNRGQIQVTRDSITDIWAVLRNSNAQFTGGLTLQVPGSLPYIERKIIDRAAFLGYPIPSIRFKLPFSSPIKSANIAALAVANKDALLALR